MISIGASTCWSWQTFNSSPRVTDNGAERKSEAGSNKKIKGSVAIFNLEPSWLEHHLAQKFDLSEWVIMGDEFSCQSIQFCSLKTGTHKYFQNDEDDEKCYDEIQVQVSLCERAPLLIIFLHAQTPSRLKQNNHDHHHNRRHHYEQSDVHDNDGDDYRQWYLESVLRFPIISWLIYCHGWYQVLPFCQREIAPDPEIGKNGKHQRYQPAFYFHRKIWPKIDNRRLRRGGESISLNLTKAATASAKFEKSLRNFWKKTSVKLKKASAKFWKKAWAKF